MNTLTNGAIYQFIANTTSGRVTVTNLPAGASGIYAEGNGTALTDVLASGTKYRIVNKNADGTINFSPYFDVANLVSKSRTLPVAAVEQITYLGASTLGTVTGLGSPAVGTTLLVRVDTRHSEIETTNQGITSDIPYLVVSGDTSTTIAKGLFDNAVRILNRSVPTPMIQVDRVVNGTAYAILNGTVGLNATLVNNSKTVTATSHGLTAGKTVVINGIGYQVASINGTISFDLDTVYTGASGNITSGTIANTTTELLEVTGTKLWGLKFTGISQTFGKQQAKTGRYEKVRFTVTPINNALAPINPINGSVIAYASGFDATVNATTTTDASEGTGTYESVAVMESLTQWQNKDFQSAAQLANYKQEANTDRTYSLINLNFKTGGTGSAVTGTDPQSYLTIILANTSGSAGDYLINSTSFAIS